MNAISRTPLAMWLGLGAAIVGGVVLYRLAKASAQLAQAGGGIVTGNNAVTQAATNADGKPTTAYVGAGIAGTVGATANAASGGVLASIGEGIGSWFYDLTHPGEPAAAAPGPTAATTQGNSATMPSGWDYSGAGQSFESLAAEGGWWPYGVSAPLGQLRGV